MRSAQDAYLNYVFNFMKNPSIFHLFPSPANYSLQMQSSRLETSRLFQRFGFGPKPGEYAKALTSGVAATRKKILSPPSPTDGAAGVADLMLTDLGKRPAPNSAGVIDFANGLRNQSEELLLWWLDKMALTDTPMLEVMTWFWHGHWATSIEKVNYPLPMYKQNVTLRTHALGNFKQMSSAMVEDPALQYWLDGQENTRVKPNENLGRELMELFTLGVNRYSEDDVKAIAKTLTGYQLNLSAAVITFNPTRYENSHVELLDTVAIFNAQSVSDFLVARDDCSTFIAERLWFRFISSTEPMPSSFKSSVKKAFAKRDIKSAIKTVINDPTLKNEKYSMVKAPVNWFIGSCRALELKPSQLNTPARMKSYLDKLGQIPFAPPSVGGWPAGEAWLTSATAQYRIEFAQWMIKQSNLEVIREIPSAKRVQASADWLGVAQWSERTKTALGQTVDDPASFALVALCSPEYVVSA